METAPRDQPTILVIDDSDAIAFAVQSAVPECHVLHAPDGIAGLDILRKSPRAISLIVLDLVMPRMDGPTACMLIRELAPDVPILPFTGYPGDQTIAPLRELSCLPPLLKPVAPTVLAETIRNALSTTPPPLTPGPGVLSWAQQQAARQEYIGRTAPMLQVIVCAATGITRSGLQDLIEQAGAQVLARTPYAQNIPDLLPITPELGIGVVTTRAELPQVLPIAEELHLPLICLIVTLGEGLDALDAVAGMSIPVALVIEHTDERQIVVRLEQALRELARGETTIPTLLREPFVALQLTAPEHLLLMADVRGLVSTIIADRLGIDPATLRQRRKRLRQKLDVPEQQTLGAWAEGWWAATVRT